ncbi:MAG TPA: MBL fold metallo-hydrolase [Polyangiaceae bacterium]|jgi:L-ascorbate metabolism protein UlaG (beta-lactamase superfamily)|nr:MBL fold metallo-hydrolase [Polyangiaceae bacterium]
MARLAPALLVAALALGGCAVVPIATRNLATLTSTPARVPHKIAHPLRADARLSVLWVGHATALVQLDDKVILTDPVFTETVGQVSRRLVEPGLEPSALPPVDAVLISHMHPDHLSLGSLELIEPVVRHLALPRGGLTYLTDFSFDAFELGTWETWERDGLRVTAVPVKHVGFRYGIDADWMADAFTGYVVEYHGLRVYFGGDTAYDERAFLETARRFPALDLALLPIGPAEPRTFMRKTHVGPEEAVQVFLDLGARRVVPIHRDTFVNSSDKPGEALARFLAEAKARALPPDAVQVVGVGEQRVLIPRAP